MNGFCTDGFLQFRSCDECNAISYAGLTSRVTLISHLPRFLSISSKCYFSISLYSESNTGTEKTDKYDFDICVSVIEQVVFVFFLLGCVPTPNVIRLHRVFHEGEDDRLKCCRQFNQNPDWSRSNFQLENLIPKIWIFHNFPQYPKRSVLTRFLRRKSLPHFQIGPLSHSFQAVPRPFQTEPYHFHPTNTKATKRNERKKTVPGWTNR